MMEMLVAKDDFTQERYLNFIAKLATSESMQWIFFLRSE